MVAKKGWFSIVESAGYGWRGDAPNGDYAGSNPVGFLQFTGDDGDPAPSPLVERAGTYEILNNELVQTGPVPDGQIGSKIGADVGTNTGFLVTRINANGSAGEETGPMIRWSDNGNFIDCVFAGGTIFLVLIQGGSISATLASYAIPSWDNTAWYEIAIWVDTTNRIKVSLATDTNYFDDHTLIMDVVESQQSAGTVFGYKSAGNIVSLDHLLLPNAVAPVASTATYYGVIHSGFDHDQDGGTNAPTSDYTATGQWLGWLSSESGTQVSGAAQFNAIAGWTGVPSTKALEYSTNVPPVWGSGAWATQNWDHIILTADNFTMEEALPDQIPTGFSASYVDLTIDLMDDAMSAIRAQGDPDDPEFLFYPYHPEVDMVPNFTGDVFNPTLAEQEAFHFYTSGDYFGWYQELYKQVREARAGYRMRLIPAAMVISDLIENESYMATVNWVDLFGDDAPHGTESLYFLYALVTYRVMMNRNPDLSAATVPAGVTVISQVWDNRAAIVSYIDTRLAEYNDQLNANVYDYAQIKEA